jgi:hypothetical protein
MRKGLGVFLIVIFLPVCASFGAVGQAQGYLLGAENGVLLVGGPTGAAQNMNAGVVAQNQRSNNPYSFVTALQTENGVLVQGAYAVGMNGLFGVGQTANVLGTQLQTVGGNPTLGIQSQCLEPTLGQYLVRDGGIGAAVGIQDFVGLDVQMVISPYGASTNVVYAGIGVFGSIAGGP